MNATEKAHKAQVLFKEVTGLDLGMHDYKHKLMLQKLIYLLQKMGLTELNYSFSWYIKGPYSTKLASDVFELFEQNKIQNVALNLQEKQLAQTLKKKFEEIVQSEDPLELLGSLVYIKMDRDITKPEQIIEKLLNLKPWYTKEQAQKMLNKIEQSQLFN